MLLNKLIAPVPMGRCWPPIEQICIGQYKGASADGTQTTDLCALFSEPTQKVGRMPFFGRPFAAGNKKRVDQTVQLSVCPVSQDRQADLARNGSVFASRDDLHLICRFAAAQLISVSKHFRWTDNIEHPCRRYGYNRDSSHTSDIRRTSSALLWLSGGHGGRKSGVASQQHYFKIRSLHSAVPGSVARCQRTADHRIRQFPNLRRAVGLNLPSDSAVSVLAVVSRVFFITASFLRNLPLCVSGDPFRERQFSLHRGPAPTAALNSAH